MTVKMLRKRKTIIDVAKVAGVSKATVARVLTGDEGVSVKTVTRKRVLDAVKEVGYVPNRIAASMRSQRTFSVAISIPDNLPLTITFLLIISSLSSTSSVISEVPALSQSQA